MLSYRHAFHAGNHADVLKHLILFLILRYFNQKDKPYWYIDTHSGTGVYDLSDAFASKIGEYQQGIARLYQADSLSSHLTDFVAHSRAILPEPLYAGSPYWAQSLLRDDDKMRLFELHPSDFPLLLNNIRQTSVYKRTIIKQEDGFKGLLALLPPATRRAVILIDPPYEQKQDYIQVVHILKESLKRFAQGCYMVWFPCLSRIESQNLPQQLCKIAPNNYLLAQLHVHTPRTNGLGMHGSGMFIINPPYVLAQQLQEILPELTRILAQDKGAKFELNCHMA